MHVDLFTCSVVVLWVYIFALPGSKHSYIRRWSHGFANLGRSTDLAQIWFVQRTYLDILT